MRLMRLRTTALPTFLVTVIPSLPASCGSDRFDAIPSRCFPCTFDPSPCTARKSDRRRRRMSLEIPKGARRPRSDDGTTSWRRSPRCACAPWRGGGGAPRGHHGSSCGRGSRACAYGSCYAAGTYAWTRLGFFQHAPRQRGLSGAGSILKGPREVKAIAPRDSRSRAKPPWDANSPRPSTPARAAVGSRSTGTPRAIEHAFGAPIRSTKRRSQPPPRERESTPETHQVSQGFRSSLAGSLSLQSKIRFCYQRPVSRLWITVTGEHGGGPGVPVENLWIGCPFVCE